MLNLVSGKIFLVSNGILNFAHPEDVLDLVLEHVSGHVDQNLELRVS
jgi:hypothetical protein